MARLQSIKIYEDGTMIAITTDLDIPIASEPFGNVRVRPFGTSGFSFVRLSTNEAIADILDFNLILDSSGSAYSGTYLGTFSALNAFLDKCCPSGGGGGGEANTASNVGAGAGVFKQKVGVDLQFKSIVVTPPLNLTAGADDLTISLAGGVGDMLASIYDPSNLQLDVYDKANETGIEQITGSIITPPILTATANNYNPPGFATANMIRQDINSNNRSISGFVAPPLGVNRIIYINNINGTGDDLRFLNNSVLSLPENRILLRDNNNKSLKDNETAAFWYDHISQRWRPLNRVG
jgi:hypothetical protein